MTQKKPKADKEEFAMKDIQGNDLTVKNIAEIHGNNLFTFYKNKDNYTAALKGLIDDGDNMVQALIWHEAQLKKANEKIAVLQSKLDKKKK